MNELWVARDWDRSIWEYPSEPVWRASTKDWTAVNDEYGLTRQLPAWAFPGLKPGQCRRLVLAEETT